MKKEINKMKSFLTSISAIIIMLLSILLPEFTSFRKDNGLNFIQNFPAESYVTTHNDVLEGEVGSSCNLEETCQSIMPLSLDSNNSCIDYCNSHGSGRETGGTGLLSTGCRNYMGWSYGNYGTIDIPYWINMNSMNTITDINKRNILIEDIRTQASFWNEISMHDGTGKLINLYEVGQGSDSRPANINGRRVVEVLRQDGSYAGQFSSSDLQIRINYDPNGSNDRAGRNVDTPLHEMGHLLGLMDLEASGTGISSGTHHTLMGYNRGTTASTIGSAIHYQDIQGVAVLNNLHTEHQYYRYVLSGGKYQHICFYCDRINSQSAALPGSQAMNNNTSCVHNYGVFVSAGNRYWLKCSKCYAVLETTNSNLRQYLFAGGDGVGSPYLISNEQQLRNVVHAWQNVYVPGQNQERQITRWFQLKNDIIVTEEWTPYELKFAGKFDGNGHSITYSTTITQDKLSNKYWGLFSIVSSPARIYNITFKNCSIKSNGSLEPGMNENINVGIMAGSFYAGEINDITVENPTIECNISNADIGGIAGHGNATFTNCSVLGGNITSSNSRYLGGMVGNGSECFFRGGTCSATITKNEYVDSDKVGKVVGNTEDTGNVNVSGATLVKNPKSCVAAGTLITLADGRQVPVESLTGNEMLLVWNLYTGRFDVAPILFIDKDPAQNYTVINLTFSDGTSVKVISEHGFFDCDLNKYVYLDKNAENYIGHWFNKQGFDENGNMIWERVQLTGVEIKTEQTVAYSPVTYSHLCYYVNGMLSMPGGISGMFNIFEVDGESMRYNEAQMQADIAEYGLYTYEEFAEQFAVSEQTFEAFNGQYLKVAMGKGLISQETIENLIARYAPFFTE